MNLTIGISACLFGKNTRYDGGHRHEPRLLEALTRFATLLPLCPEAECGLGIPREPMRLEGDPEGPRLLTLATRRDLTAPMLAWADQRLEAFADEGLAGLILKSRSPSCGTRVTVHGEGEPAFSPGLFVRACQERFPGLPIANEEELRDPARLADFRKRVTSYAQNNLKKQR